MRWPALMLLGMPSLVSAQQWQLSSKPLLEIGVVEGDPNYELFDARSSIRLRDGRIVVLNSGANELRIFDKQGKFVAKAGRRGNGPGEFRAATRIYYTHADSFLVYDAAATRENHFDAQGNFVASADGVPVKGDAFPRDVWVYGRFLVDGPPRPADRPAVKGALDRLPEPAPGTFQRVRIDPWRRLWVSHARGSWTIYDRTGNRVAQLSTPASFELHQIGPDFLLGRNRTELDVEVIQLWALNGRGANAGASYFTPAAAQTYTPAPEPKLPEETAVAMRGYLRTMMSQQEVHYSRAMTYTADATQLKLPEDKNLTAHILYAHNRGWAAALVHKDLDSLCVVAQGFGADWTPGRVVCGEPRRR
jgi:hypothetical protein